MARPASEIADIFRDHGPAWRKANAGHVSLGQLKVMSAIESCRTVALGGHVMRCEDCSHTQIAYNSCRNRHCPKCQGSQALAWMKQRKSELLDVPYFHVVFTLPARIAAIAYQNKAVVYDLLFKASSQTMLTIAADPKRLGVKIGFISVLHTWGSAMTHHPHVHMIVPGGGISLDGTRWISCRPNERAQQFAFRSHDAKFLRVDLDALGECAKVIASRSRHACACGPFGHTESASWQNT